MTEIVQTWEPSRQLPIGKSRPNPSNSTAHCWAHLQHCMICIHLLVKSKESCVFIYLISELNLQRLLTYYFISNPNGWNTATWSLLLWFILRILPIYHTKKEDAIAMSKMILLFWKFIYFIIILTNSFCQIFIKLLVFDENT